NGADGPRLVIEWPGDVAGDPIARIAAQASAAQPPADPAVASNDATSRLISGIAGQTAPATATTPASTAPPAESPVAATLPPATPASPMRELVIAIDAGHGGQDPGAIGPSGTYEKNVVLAIARELARQINA